MHIESILKTELDYDLTACVGVYGWSKYGVVPDALLALNFMYH